MTDDDDFRKSAKRFLTEVVEQATGGECRFSEVKIARCSKCGKVEAVPEGGLTLGEMRTRGWSLWHVSPSGQNNGMWCPACRPDAPALKN